MAIELKNFGASQACAKMGSRLIANWSVVLPELDGKSERGGEAVSVTIAGSVEAGAEAFTIKQILRPAYLRTTESYTNAPQKSVVDAMEAIGLSPSLRNHLDNRRIFPYISPADETPNSSPNTFEVDSEVVAVKCGDSDLELKGS